MLSKLPGLRSKMLIIASSTLLLIFALLFIAARYVLLNGYARLEQDKTTIQANSAITLLNDQAVQVNANNRDNAHWDDMYAFVQKPSEEFRVSSLNDAMHTNLKVQAIFIVNNNGEIVFERGLNYLNNKPWHIPDTLRQAVVKNGVLIDPSKKNIYGFFDTPEGTLMVSANDILDSNEQLERRGTLIMARLVDDDLLARIGKTLGVDMSIETLRLDELAYISPELVNNQTVVLPINDKSVIGYKLLNNIGGDAKLLAKVAGDRKIFEQGQSSLKFFYLSLSLVALILALFSWLFDKFVISRIARLNANVQRIAATADATDRIAEDAGNDELTSLTYGINQMLVQLDESQQALQLEKELAQVSLSSIADAVITSNMNDCVLYMNAAAERLTGISGENAINKRMQDVFHLMTADKTTKVNSLWLTNPKSIVDEVLMTRDDGEEFILSKSASPLHDNNNKQFGTVTVLHDVTILRMMSNQLSHQARFDALTGLANRYEFDRKAQLAIDDVQTTALSHCIAFIDLDKFKLVNDSCGHMAGDMFLKQLAKHMQTKLRSADILARLGGDEFALLLMGCNLTKANQIVHDLLLAVQAFRFEYDNKVFKVGASIGLTEISPHKKLSLSELLATADSACYAAKRDGGNCVHEYEANDSNMQEKNNLLSWVSRINVGLEQNQFVLFMQPIQGLKASREAHCELLIRMKGDDGMLYPPNTFLPAAERYHLMPQLDSWVVNQAFSIIAAKGEDFNTLCAINLSGQSLSQEGFLEYVLAKIKQYNIEPKKICFEITETAVISNLEKAQYFMRELRAIGCRFSLDDFGSGLSSFAYLKNLQVDFLKIDGMFVKNIANNKIDRAMVESINNVGHVMGLRTIAEFVENQAIIDVLLEIGVDYVQGYGVAMPVLFE